MTSLANQLACNANASIKIHSTILGIAIVDALGGPAEFHTRFKFPPVFSMIPNDNFGLPAGVWTDDTSMTLCLARSLARRGVFDEQDQMDAYASWHRSGVLSAIDKCFDIGATISQAIHVYERSNSPTEGLKKIKEKLSGSDMSGNGSLMRVAPIGLAYWRSDDDELREFARRSSAVTHPSPMCLEACECDYVVKAGSLELFNTFPYRNSDLRAALSCKIPTDNSENYLQTHHPILKLIADVRTENPQAAIAPKQGEKKQKKKENLFDYFLSATERAFKDPAQGKLPALPSVNDLPSTGYVLDTIVAALYCFFSTTSFEDGAIAAVNLGSDADTVGAIYASIASCFYGCEDSSPRAAEFMSERVREWTKHLVRKDTVVQVAGELVKFAHGQI